MKKIALFILFMFFITPICLAKNQEVYFEPKNVVLKGVIVMLKFPGPPNYESIKNGDKDETGPYLLLTNPIDIKLPENAQNSTDTTTNNVKILQLVVLNDKDWKNVKQDNYVQVTGTLSSSVTGHHHARALLDIQNIKVLSKKKIDKSHLNLTNEDNEFLKNQHLQE